MIFVITSLVFILIDFALCKVMKRDDYDRSESLMSLGLHATNVTLVMTGLDFNYFPNHFSPEPLINLHQLVALKAPFLNTSFFYLFITFLIVDLAYYGIHRLHHEVGIFWIQHSVHHSTKRLNFLATHRNPLRITSLSLPAILLSLPMLFGYRQDVAVWILGWIQLHQTLLHSEWIPRFWRPLEWILNSPYHHRIHHSEDIENQCGNYGGVLILFDRLFGTCIEFDYKKLTYGLKGELPSNNPFVVNYRSWGRLYQSVRTAQSIPHALRILFVPRSLLKETLRSRASEGFASD